ncbi:hypothetical protein ACH4PU_34180 [Streptomyces sp. NPDC021100]|uniref:hypothetical protein n=1 Tax=Streptomyces sp. NPDC021100 TaxID=3365114 RepID=UPI0037BDDAC0
MPHSSIAALDELIGTLSVGPSRQRQLGMVRQELTTALEQGALPDGTRRSLLKLLDEAVLGRYVETAETGALRSRLVNGEKPPTSQSTNAARLVCLEIIRQAAGLPALVTRPTAAVELRPVPHGEALRALRRRLRQDVHRTAAPGHARFIALLAVVLDTQARAGELVAQRIDHLASDGSSIQVTRYPQHGTHAEAQLEAVPLSPLGTAALARWLAARAVLTETLEGSCTALWVSLAHNHTGASSGDDNSFTHRRAGMPLQQRGLIRSYNTGRHRYGLSHLLPPKLEQLRRALVHEPATS